MLVHFAVLKYSNGEVYLACLRLQSCCSTSSLNTRQVCTNVTPVLETPISSGLVHFRVCLAGDGQYPEVDAQARRAAGLQGSLFRNYSPRNQGCHGTHLLHFTDAYLLAAAPD